MKLLFLGYGLLVWSAMFLGTICRHIQENGSHFAKCWVLQHLGRSAVLISWVVILGCCLLNSNHCYTQQNSTPPIFSPTRFWKSIQKSQEGRIGFDQVLSSASSSSDVDKWNSPSLDGASHSALLWFSNKSHPRLKLNQRFHKRRFFKHFYTFYFNEKARENKAHYPTGNVSFLRATFLWSLNVRNELREIER